jgi:hypothetical protein
MKQKVALGVDRFSVLLIGLALAPAARAAPPSTLRVAGAEGACPAPGQVVTVLQRLLVRTQVTADAGTVGPNDAVIDDQGSQFRVTVAGQERSFVDPARGCAERAQHAAVFVALVLDPPMIAEAQPGPVVVAPAPVAPMREQPRPASPSRTNARQWELALGGSVLVAPAVADRSTAVAGGVAAWVRGKKGFHLGFGAGVLHGSLHFTDADADAWWIPLDLAVGFTAQGAAWEMGAEIGPSASVLSIIGENLAQAHREVRLEFGGRAAVMARFWLDKKFALFMSAEGVYRPSPYALFIDPDGLVGQTPSIWLGGSAGVCASLE